jgi:prepilin-type N-terminal cleavage/methylation domain-containing protein
VLRSNRLSIHASRRFDGRPICGTFRAGFTLVELLVVIGIIALLIGILLPALSRAREQAKMTACLSNQRQIAMAFLQYANDNRGCLPPYGYMLNNSSNELPDQYWWQLISKYFSKHGTKAGIDFMRCPSELVDAQRYSSYGVNYGYTQFNALICYFAIGFNDPGFNGSKRITKVKPGTFITADVIHWAGQGDLAIYTPVIWPMTIDADGDGLKDSSSIIYPSGKTKYNHFDPRHGKGAVCSFIDGSARKVLLKDYILNKDNLWGK